MATTVVPAAESATAEPLPNFDPATYTEEQRSEWMATGDLPTVDKPAESAPAPAAGATKVDEPATESAPVHQEQKKGGEERKAQLAREIQESLDRRRSVQTEWDEFESWKKTKGATAAPPPATSTHSTSPQKPARPQFGEKDGETLEQFETREGEWHEALVDYKLALRKQEDEQKSAQATADQGWNERKEAAKSKYADYAEVAFSETTPINPAMNAFILRHKLGAEVLYELGKNSSAEGKRIFALADEIDTIAELTAIALSLGTKTEPPVKTAPVLPITKAARPGTDLKASNGAPPDPVRAAVESDDFTRFFEEQNAMDVARRKRG